MMVEGLIELSRRIFGDELLGLLLFGSRARGDYSDQSDYDILIVLKGYISGDPTKTYFEAYRGFGEFREATGRDTTVLVISFDDLLNSLSSSIILNALLDGVIIFDESGMLRKVRDKVYKKLESLGIKRVKENWGYSWHVPINLIPFNLEVNVNDPTEYEYRIRLAEEHLEEALKALEGGALVAAIYEAQLSIESSAKAVIGFFKPPTWIHNPASELRQVTGQYEELLRRKSIPIQGLNKLIALADEAAPHHALARYGDPGRMVTPRGIYKLEDAKKLVGKAEEALRIARETIEKLR